MTERRKPPNHLLRQARRRLPSTSGSGRSMSRQELADAVNAYLAGKDHERCQREATLDANHIGKLERGEHRWPNDPRREAFRHVLEAATDAELGFWIIRGLDSESAATANERRPDLPSHSDARPDGATLDAGERGTVDTAASTGVWGVDDTYRRTLLRGALAGAGLGLFGSALTLDDISHIAAALHDARRYLDGAVVGHLRERLVQCADDDGRHGPKAALPPVLAVMTVVEHNARQVKPAVRRELLGVGARGAEFAGWLYRDIGAPELAEYWRDRATEWALEAGDYAMPGYVLLKKSQSAWDTRDALRMLTLAQAVQDGPWLLPARVRAEAAQQEARGYAMIDGDIDTAVGKLDEARELLTSDSSDGRSSRDAELAAHYDRSLLAVQTAICHCEAGQPDQAVDIYREALDPSVFSPRDHAYFLSLMGLALAATDRPDEAVSAGMRALPIAVAASSLRTVRELQRLRGRLRIWTDRPAVREFCAAVPAWPRSPAA